ncbi:hypothetical protein IMG5_010900 [Ichthyophthirius multifiliis]|uniref:Tetratricopeptide repeat protein n=1 Tax=Ichthyophthirius multifiliis TaxID=5932 RepID=G0QK03_ICHMU|nr:hypothetical protein IMG5_010900 [Ichthyophthirius multifiliis]EGR34463.1 hypothetical protein IMG5_010900 [Ichthyophthirius multifiliis]|eukprot:XP_004039767.1 hypothetical protein IMG5_010900 [Ichthyophthirius multifiliis]
MENYDSAIKCFQEISDIEQNEEIEHNLGMCFYLKGDIDQSIDHLQNALKINPKKENALYNLGNALSILFQPENIEWLSYVAEVFFINEEYDNAKKLFEKILELDNMNIDANLKMAQLEYAQKNTQNAILHMNKVLYQQSDNVEAQKLKKIILGQ